jgi:hypothetical protein
MLFFPIAHTRLLKMYSPAWPHSEIKAIFPAIFYVTGTNITTFNNTELQHSRNMIIIRENGKLSLINTVRLDEKGLAALEALGDVENIIRIGAFHGRDDAFYCDRYHAKLWALPGMQHDILLQPNSLMPFADCSVFIFETSKHPEAILHIAKQGGILVTCDSIKNWELADKFFSDATAKLYQQQHFFGTAIISDVWLQACNVKAADFEKIKSLRFKHLLSAHGHPLLNTAYESVTKTLLQS